MYSVVEKYQSVLGKFNSENLLVSAFLLLSSSSPTRPLTV